MGVRHLMLFEQESVSESCSKLKVQDQHPDLECLTPWAKLRKASVLQFRSMLIFKKLSGRAPLTGSRASWWIISSSNTGMSQAGMTQAQV